MGLLRGRRTNSALQRPLFGTPGVCYSRSRPTAARGSRWNQSPAIVFRARTGGLPRGESPHVSRVCRGMLSACLRG
jgi:hypothetical protein